MGTAWISDTARVANCCALQGTAKYCWQLLLASKVSVSLTANMQP